MNPEKKESKIFISHSFKDKDLVDLLVQAIRTVGVGNSSIIYTSDKATGFDYFSSIMTEIKEKINEAEIIILVITPNFLNSDYCKVEYGASFALSDNKFVFPLCLDKKEERKKIDGTDILLAGPTKDDAKVLLSAIIKKFDNIGMNMDYLDEFIEASEKYLEKECEHGVKAETICTKNHDDKKDVGRLLDISFLSTSQKLLLLFILEENVPNLYDRWKASFTIDAIVKWESKNCLNSELSENYPEVLSFLKYDGWIESVDKTSCGNTIEYKVSGELQTTLRNMSDQDLEDLYCAASSCLKE